MIGLNSLAHINKGEIESLFNDAKGHDLVSQYELGLRYYHGYDVKQNYREAVKWWRKAAEDGLVFAQYALGTCFLLGKGVKKSKSTATKWLWEAIEHGLFEVVDIQKDLGKK